MSERQILPLENIDSRAASAMAQFHGSVVAEVARAVGSERLVVVGMAQNPFVKKARQALDGAGVEFKYLEYGSYFSAWKQRLAIKLWSGWPTFPQVFVNGVLIGGCTDLKAALQDGRLQAMVKTPGGR